MAMQDEVSLIESILKKPKIHMDMEAAKHLGNGGESTGPSFEYNPGVPPITKEDVQAVTSSSRGQVKVTPQAIKNIREDVDAANRIMGLQKKRPMSQLPQDEETGEVNFDDVVEQFFENVDCINNSVDELVEASGRVGRKMKVEWVALLKQVKRFEFYYDRAMSRLEE